MCYVFISEDKSTCVDMLYTYLMTWFATQHSGLILANYYSTNDHPSLCKCEDVRWDHQHLVKT